MTDLTWLWFRVLFCERMAWHLNLCAVNTMFSTCYISSICQKKNTIVTYLLNIQGVPKVCSSKFMHHNVWSKLYFYMKLLEDVYFSIEYMYSEFQLLACSFCFFLSHSVAVAAWSGIQLVDPQMIHFELLYHLLRQGQFNPQTIFV